MQSTVKSRRDVIRFYHSSTEPQFSPSTVRDIVSKYGTSVLIGGDPGFGDEFEASMAAVDAEGALKHVYLVGPGMMSWSKAEAQEVKDNAESVGIDTSSSDWKDKWYHQGGWEIKVQQWFAEYSAKGYYSAEIDNLDSVWDQDPQANLDFLIRFSKYCRDNSINTKLMVKNLNTDQLSVILDAIDKTNPLFDIDFLAPFGMFEAGTGNPKEQIYVCKALGITAVTPMNGMRETHTYGTDFDGIEADLEDKIA